MIHEMCSAWTIVGGIFLALGAYTKNSTMMTTAIVVICLASVKAFI